MTTLGIIPALRVQTLLVVLALTACGPKEPPAAAAEPTPAAVPGEGEAAEAGAPGMVLGPDGTPVPATPADPWGGQSPEIVLRKRLDDAAALLTTGQESQAHEALAQLKRLAELSPDTAEVPYNMGVAHQSLGEESRARKQYLRATELDPTLSQAWLNLGALSEQRGDYERALLNYRAGLRHSPDEPDLVVGVIGVLRKMNRHDEAVEQAKKALSRNANNTNAYNNLGLVYLDQGKVDMALFIYQRALGFIDGADQNAFIHCPPER